MKKYQVLLFALAQIVVNVQASSSSSVTVPVVQHYYNTNVKNGATQYEWLAVCNSNTACDVLSSEYSDGQAIWNEFKTYGVSENDFHGIDKLKDSSINIALKSITPSQWGQGVYLQAFVYNNELYVVAFNKNLHVYACVTGLSISNALSDISSAQIQWTGSYVANSSGSATRIVTPYNTNHKEWSIMGFASNTKNLISSFALEDLLKVQAAGLALEQEAMTSDNLMVQKFEKELKAMS